MRAATSAIVALALVTCSLSYLKADEVTLIPADGYATGGSINALAGPLTGSDVAFLDVPGSGVDSVAAALLGNTVTHTYSVELDFSTSPAFFESVYSGFERTSTLSHRASAESIYYFSVDVPTAYSVEGFFSVADALGTTIPGNVELEIELLEFADFSTGSPPPETKLYTYQASKSTLDVGLIAGETEGDFANEMEGSLDGVLDPGKFYRYRTLATINAIDIDGTGPEEPTDGGATATGAHIIRFSPFSGVPEPNSAGLCGLLAAGLWIRRRRERQCVRNQSVG